MLWEQLFAHNAVRRFGRFVTNTLCRFCVCAGRRLAPTLTCGFPAQDSCFRRKRRCLGGSLFAFFCPPGVGGVRWWRIIPLVVADHPTREGRRGLGRPLRSKSGTIPHFIRYGRLTKSTSLPTTGPGVHIVRRRWLTKSPLRPRQAREPHRASRTTHEVPLFAYDGIRGHIVRRR